MQRVARIAFAVLLVLGAGCTAPAPDGTAKPTETRTNGCSTFGTGGIAPLNETNATVTSVSEADRSLRTVVADESDVPYNASDYRNVPREEVDDRGAVRDELEPHVTNETLYYFSPTGERGLDEMLIVSEDGAVFIVFIGAC